MPEEQAPQIQDTAAPENTAPETAAPQTAAEKRSAAGKKAAQARWAKHNEEKAKAETEKRDTPLHPGSPAWEAEQKKPEVSKQSPGKHSEQIPDGWSLDQEFGFNAPDSMSAFEQYVAGEVSEHGNPLPAQEEDAPPEAKPAANAQPPEAEEPKQAPSEEAVPAAEESEPQEEPTEPETPDLIFGKYKSVQEAEKAYKAAENRMHQAAAEAADIKRHYQAVAAEHNNALKWIGDAQKYIEHLEQNRPAEAETPDEPVDWLDDPDTAVDRKISAALDKFSKESEARQKREQEQQARERQQRIANEMSAQYDRAGAYFDSKYQADFEGMDESARLDAMRGVALTVAGYISTPKGLREFQANHEVVMDKIAGIAKNHPDKARALALKAYLGTQDGAARYANDPELVIDRINGLFRDPVKTETPKPAPSETRTPLSGPTGVKTKPTITPPTAPSFKTVDQIALEESQRTGRVWTV